MFNFMKPYWVYHHWLPQMIKFVWTSKPMLSNISWWELRMSTWVIFMWTVSILFGFRSVVMRVKIASSFNKIKYSNLDPEVMTIMYSNTTPGIINPAVFDIPKQCTQGNQVHILLSYSSVLRIEKLGFLHIYLQKYRTHTLTNNICSI